LGVPALSGRILGTEFGTVLNRREFPDECSGMIEMHGEIQDLLVFGPEWRLGLDGIWVHDDVPEVSYPDDGNDGCFQLEEHSFWFRHRNKVIESLVGRFANHSTFFDVGGGNGFVSKGLQNAGYDVVLVEPGAHGVRNGRSRGIKNVVQSVWSPQTVNTGVAAAVGLFDVVEHIEDDLQFLQGVYETLAPDGLVFITVPAFTLLWSSEDVHAGHFRRYRLSQLRALLQKAGFRIEFSSYFFCPLTLPIFLVRSIPSFIGLRTEVDPATTTREHVQNSGLAGRIMGRILSWEASRIAAGKSVPFGSSCLIVGRKIVGGR